MKPAALAAIIALSSLGGACAIHPGSAMPAAAPAGFLGTSTIRALVDAVPASPAPGSSLAQADEADSQRIRTLEDGDRWTLATRHAELRPAIAVSHFDCALGVRLTEENAPALVALLERVLVDASAAADLAKTRAFRARPVSIEPERRACQVVTTASRASASYPSGSAAAGAAYGEVFAALAPDRAAEARETARQIGLSRVVCAMHYRSDVEAGATLGKAVVAAEQADAGFGAALALGRADLDRARASGLTSPACAAERLALGRPLP